MSFRDQTGFSQRRKHKGILIDAPKHGDVLPEDRDVDRQRSSRHSIIGIGRDNLNENKANQIPAASTRYQAIPAASFYGQTSSSDTQARQKATSISASTPSSSRGAVMTSESPLDQPSQFRNASNNGSRSTRSSSKPIKETVSEAVDVSSEEEVEMTTPSQRRTTPKSHFPQNPFVASNHNPTLLFRNADSGGEDEEIGTPVRNGDSSRRRDISTQGNKLSKLDNERSIRIASSEEEIQEIDKKMALETVKTPSSIAHNKREEKFEIHSKMKGRPTEYKGMSSNAKVLRNSLGNTYTASLAPKKEKSRPLADEARESHLRRHLFCDSVNFFDLGQLPGLSVDTRIEWDVKGDITVLWLENSKRMKILISLKDIVECSICQVISHPSIRLKVKKRDTHLSSLETQISVKPLQTYVLGKDNPSLYIILFMPKKTDETFREEEWDELVTILKDSRVQYTEWTSNSVILAKSILESIPQILRKGNPELADPEGKRKKKPIAYDGRVNDLSRVSTLSTAHPRMSQRQQGKGTEEEEESKAIQMSLEEEKARKRAMQDPNKQRLYYPFEGAGGVTAFQGDIDKLEDREMLNDTIIEIGLKYLLKQIEDRNPKLYAEIYVFSSFFYKRINEGKRDRRTTFEAVKKWTQKVDIFSKKYLVIPINEKMHWYLAIIVNPYYAVREYVEKQRKAEGKYDGEENMEELASTDMTLATVDAEEAEEEQDRIEGAKDGQGDTLMMPEEEKEEEGEKEEKEEGELSTDKMDIDNEEDSGGTLPFFEEAAPEEELIKGFQPKSTTSMKGETKRIPVADLRKSVGNVSLSNDDESEEDCTFVSVSKGTPSRTAPRKSNNDRPGISDGFSIPSITSRGHLVGGGEKVGNGTPIVPGESFAKEENDEQASKRLVSERKRKINDDEDYQDMLRPPSPMRSRSGLTLRRSASVVREETQGKYQRWLWEKAVVCVFDSLGGKHKGVGNALKDYIWLEYNDKKGAEMTVEDVQLEHIDVCSPTQSNFCDCGLYLLHAFERFFDNPNLMVNEVLARRGGDLHEHWQEKEAAKKRKWWRALINTLADEWEKRQEANGGQRRGRRRGKREGEGKGAMADQQQEQQQAQQQAQEEVGSAERTEKERNDLDSDMEATTSRSESEGIRTPPSDASTRSRGTNPVVDIQYEK